MSTHNEPENPQELEKAVSAGYEHRDFDFGKIGKGSSVSLVILCAVSLVATFLVLMIYDRVVQGRSSFMSTFDRQSPSGRATLPPAPLLQSNITAKTDIADLRKAELEAMTTYGYVDKEKGIVRIPVDAAIDRLAKTGLSASAPAAQEATTP
ncbi:MAG: hypothetical protein JNM85_04650 [Chthonomonas sp.]|nr:hypothetical protein [Chthonomonas sp.]